MAVCHELYKSLDLQQEKVIVSLFRPRLTEPKRDEPF